MCTSDYVYALWAPIAMMVAAVYLGTSTNCFGEKDCIGPHYKFNYGFAQYGPLIAVPVLVIRLILLPFGKLQEAGVLGKSWCQCFVGTFCVWAVLCGLRYACYAYYMGPSNLFSDHIFLACSIVALLQMEIVIALWAKASEFPMWRWVPSFVLAWGITLRIGVLAYNTSRFYHTPSQSWLSIALGVPLMSSIAFWWTQHIRGVSGGAGSFDGLAKHWGYNQKLLDA